MLSIITSVRNSTENTCNLLASLKDTFAKSDSEVEFLLIDDNSDKSNKIIELFLDFRKSVKSDVRIFRFKKHQQYVAAFSLGLSQAKGDYVIFISNDMIVTPHFFNILTEVAEKDGKIGIVRGTSQYTDTYPNYSCVPPLAIRNYQDILDFSAYVSKYCGNDFVEDQILIGDAVLIKRSVIDAIGVFDTRYYGYFGDIDYGVRAKRAGFKLVCAKGAWLYHKGAGSVKQESIDKKVELKMLCEDRMQDVQRAYSEFRKKWDTSLPEAYPNIPDDIDFKSIIKKTNTDINEYQEPIKPEDFDCELI